MKIIKRVQLIQLNEFLFKITKDEKYQAYTIMLLEGNIKLYKDSIKREYKLRKINNKKLKFARDILSLHNILLESIQRNKSSSLHNYSSNLAFDFNNENKKFFDKFIIEYVLKTEFTNMKCQIIPSGITQLNTYLARIFFWKKRLNKKTHLNNQEITDILNII